MKRAPILVACGLLAALALGKLALFGIRRSARNDETTATRELDLSEFRVYSEKHMAELVHVDEKQFEDLARQRRWSPERKAEEARAVEEKNRRLLAKVAEVENAHSAASLRYSSTKTSVDGTLQACDEIEALAPWCALALVAAACVLEVLRAIRRSRHKVVEPAPFLRALSEEHAGNVSDKGYSATLEGSPARISLVHEEDGTRWWIQVAASPSTPRNVAIRGVSEIVELASSCRAAARKDPAMGRLADSLADFAKSWEMLFRVYSVASVAFEEGAVVARAGFGGASFTPRDEARRVLALAARLAALTSAIGRILELKARAAASARCPYCHDEVQAASAGSRACESCGAVHHAECYLEYGKCAVFGCRGRVERVQRAMA